LQDTLLRAPSRSTSLWPAHCFYTSIYHKLCHVSTKNGARQKRICIARAKTASFRGRSTRYTSGRVCLEVPTCRHRKPVGPRAEHRRKTGAHAPRQDRRPVLRGIIPPDPGRGVPGHPRRVARMARRKCLQLQVIRVATENQPHQAPPGAPLSGVNPLPTFFLICWFLDASV